MGVDEVFKEASQRTPTRQKFVKSSLRFFFPSPNLFTFVPVPAV